MEIVLSSTKSKYLEICSLCDLDNKKKELLNVCSHPNKIRKREDGPYGERYWYCDKCKLEF